MTYILQGRETAYPTSAYGEYAEFNPSREVKEQEYKMSTLRPNPEYCVQLWTCQHRKDMHLMERVQRRQQR